MTISERRRFSRVDFDARVELTQDQQTWAAELEDISLKGVLLSHVSGPAPVTDSGLQLKILLSDQTALNMTVDVVHRSGTQLGLTYALVDIESIGHLRRLIELNTGDPAVADRELAELIGTAR